MWAGETQASAAPLIESKTAAHFSDASSSEIKAIKVGDAHNEKNICFGSFGGFNYCDWDIAGLHDDLVFRADHIAYLRSGPICQGKWINDSGGFGGIWTIVLNRNALRGHISSVFNGNAYTPNYRLLRWIWSERGITKINKGAISQSRCLIGFVQNGRSES